MNSEGINWEQVTYLLKSFGVKDVYVKSDYGNDEVLTVAVEGLEKIDIANPEFHLKRVFKREFKIISYSEVLSGQFRLIKPRPIFGVQTNKTS